VPATKASSIDRPGDAEHQAGDRGELDARIFQHLMQPIGFAGALLNDRLAIAREIPQLPNRRRRHEALADEPVLEQLRDPHAVLHVGLPAGHLRDLCSVGQDTDGRLLEDIEDRLPVDPGAFHGDPRDLEGFEPIAQAQQVSCGGAERPHVLLARPVRARYTYTGRHRLLVHIQPAAPVDQALHGAPPR